MGRLLPAPITRGSAAPATAPARFPSTQQITVRRRQNPEGTPVSSAIAASRNWYDRCGMTDPQRRASRHHRGNSHSKEETMTSSPSRRRVLKAAAAGTGLAFFRAVQAFELRPGQETNQARTYLRCQRTVRRQRAGRLARHGHGDRRVQRQGGVLGRKLTYITQDTETTPATGSRIAERFITRDECGFLIGALSSGVANAVSQVAQKYGCIYLNSNSSSPTEAGKDCHRTKFVWDGNGTNFSKATVKNAVSSLGKNWLLLTNDYVWGINTSKATRAEIEASGGKVIDELMVPQNTRDFTSVPAQDPAGQTGRGRSGDRRRRHQGHAAAGHAIQAR
jgi:hypothetical protein